MFNNYLKIAWRNLFKNRVFTMANILGLSTAFAISILLAMTALFELSFDRFHGNKDFAYQLYRTDQSPRGPGASTSLPAPLAPALEEEIPGIAHIARAVSDDVLISHGDMVLGLDAEYADPDYFKIFTFPTVSGNAENPLPNNSSMALGEATAKKLFGNQDALGRTVTVQIAGQESPYTVTAVLQDTPSNSSIDFEVVLPFESYPWYRENRGNWNSQFHNVYLQLEEGTGPANLEVGSRGLVNLHYKNGIENAKRDGALPDANGQYKQLKLLPISDMHFASYSSGIARSNRSFPFIILGIALVVIFIVCANFINMNIALTEKRLKEIGMRKTLGAQKKQLFFQFWLESLILFAVSLCFGLLASKLLLEPFRTLFRTKADFDHILRADIILYFALVLFCISLVAGGYPSLVASRIGSIRALKGKMELGRNRLRNGLIVLQFCIAIILISGSLVLHGQIQYLGSKDLGYNKEQVVSIPLNAKMDSYRMLELLRQELNGIPGILGVSGADNNLGLGRDGSHSSSKMGFDYKERGITTHILNVDHDYAKTLDIELLMGRMFSREFKADSLGLVINESMAQLLGEEDPLSVRIPMGDTVSYSVIGVVKDFHFENVGKAVEPLTLFMQRDQPLYYGYVKVAPGNFAASFDAIKASWEKIAPRAEFLGSFLDENLDRTLKRERSLASIITSGSILGILLSCIGLFAMTLLVVAQRTKEIGVRKVIGASVPSLTLLLTKDFLKLVGLAFVIAAPISWYILNEWLQDYAFRISLSPLFFIGAGLLATLIALLTIGTKTVKAASANPVKSLRSE